MCMHTHAHTQLPVWICVNEPPSYHNLSFKHSNLPLRGGGKRRRGQAKASRVNLWFRVKLILLLDICLHPPSRVLSHRLSVVSVFVFLNWIDYSLTDHQPITSKLNKNTSSWLAPCELFRLNKKNNGIVTVDLEPVEPTQGDMIIELEQAEHSLKKRPGMMWL